MKVDFSNMVTIGGFIILGVVNHYQLKFKVVHLESKSKVDIAEIKLYIKDKLDDLKKELKVNNIVLRD